MKTAAITRTRYAELGIQFQGDNNWRYIDLGTGNAVGPAMRTKAEAFAYLTEYAATYGCENAALLKTEAADARRWRYVAQFLDVNGDGPDHSVGINGSCWVSIKPASPDDDDFPCIPIPLDYTPALSVTDAIDAAIDNNA